MACYAEQAGAVTQSATGGSCGPSSRNGTNVETCCAVGDTCLSNGFCQYTHTGNNGGSGFYMAGCTDQTFQDPACPRQCADQLLTDAVYNFTTGTWSCCGVTGGPQGVRQCMDPLGATFEAPAPGSLQKLLFVSTPGINSAADSASPTATPGSTNDHSGLPMGAIIGIAVGASVLFCGLVALGAILFFRRHRKAQTTDSPDLKPGYGWDKKSSQASSSGQMPYGQQNPSGSLGHVQVSPPSQASVPIISAPQPPPRARQLNELATSEPYNELAAREQQPELAVQEVHVAELSNTKSPHPLGYI